MKPSLLLAFFLLFTVGCGALGGGMRTDPFATGGQRSLGILVENSTDLDLRVEVRGTGERHDLGIVHSRSSRQLAVPWEDYQEVRFVIDPIGGRQVTVRGAAAGPGSRVNLVIVTPLNRSFVRN